MRSIALFAFTLVGCAADPVANPDDDRDIATDEGSVGSVWVNTPTGPMRLTYIVEGGHAIHEGDIDLGPVSELRNRGGAANLGERWPDGRVYFAFDPVFDGQVCDDNGMNCVNVRARVRDVLADLDVQLPITVKEVAFDEIPDEGAVIFEWGPPDQNQAGKASHIGHEGGKQYIRFKPSLPFNTQPERGTTRHEFLHAIGLWHEQSRNDRDVYIDVDFDCIKEEGHGNYGYREGSADVGLYDYQSIMHYRTTSQCVRDANDNCICPTMTPLVPGAVIAEVASQGGLSVEDVNVLFRMYAKPLVVNETGDAWGTALAIGDFDADGYEDLAVGAPDEDVGDVADAGAVVVFRGTSVGPVVWAVILESDYPTHGAATGERFGAALAALDFNGDGFDDLAIGAPGENGTAGAVFVFAGSSGEGFVPHRMLTQSNTLAGVDEAGDRFGAALGGGPIAGVRRGTKLLDALVVGAPGDATTSAAGNATQKSGAVYVFQESYSGDVAILHKPTRVAPAGAAGDNFGAALAVGFLDLGRADVVVGAPGASRAYVYTGQLPPEPNPFLWSSMLAFVSQMSGTKPDQFGAAITFGPYGSSARTYVFVGAPNHNTRGIVRGFTGVLTTPFLALSYSDSSGSEPGDEFGAALALRDGSLYVGAPGEDDDRGKVTRVDGITQTTIHQDLFDLQDGEVGDRFGASLAVGHLDGSGERPSTAHVVPRHQDIAIGTPGEAPFQFFGPDDPPAGAVFLLEGTTISVKPWFAFDQEFAHRLPDP